MSLPAHEPLILVVDDYCDARALCAEFLAFSGFRVAEAQDGQEALDKAFALRPDAILMDLSLPVLDGLEATRRIKRDARTAHIPVVALSGNAPREAAGLDVVLLKPCLLEDVVSALQHVLAPAAA